LNKPFYLSLAVGDAEAVASEFVHIGRTTCAGRIIFGFGFHCKRIIGIKAHGKFVRQRAFTETIAIEAPE